VEEEQVIMPNVLITGANRGLGLEFTRQYNEDGWRVFACCRDPEKAEELNELAGASKGAVSVHALDVSRGNSVTALAETFRGEPVDILLNNSGIYGDKSKDDFGKIDYDRWAKTFSVNVMGAMRMVEAFVDNISSSERKVLAFVSSLMGSIADNGSGGSYMYRSSKAAVNAVAKSLSIDLKGRGLISVILHPGWVLTDMGGKNAPLRPEESIAGMRRVLEALQSGDSGKFLSYAGAELPW
jgi:NAD(P)-dependent dehydrogenase (short-subunit alcohol dehydrogenase family)